jgi:hypothetical protein
MALSFEIHWNTVLTAEQIEEYFQLTYKLDPRFARLEREFWQSRTAPQLAALAAGAWRSNDRETFVMAKSYAALAPSAVGA